MMQVVDINSWPVIATALVAILVIQLWFFKPRYPNVPTLRISKKIGPLGEWEDAQASVLGAGRQCELGWQRYSKHGVNYLLSTPMRKVLILAPKYFKEFMAAPESVVHTLAAQNIVMQNTYTLSKSINDDNWHMVMPVRRDLVHNTAQSIPHLLDEGKLALNDYMALSQGGTVTKNAFDLAFAVVVRTANRVLFGEKLARDPKWQEVSIKYSTVLFGGADIIKNYPTFVRKAVLKLKTPLTKVQQDGRNCLVPVIEERIAKERLLAKAEWDSIKPNDMIQWVLDATKGRDIEDLYLRLLHMTIASVHTTSFTFVEVLHCMAVRREYINELRQEVIEVLRAEGGWTKQVVTCLQKLDSFINEASRLCVLSSLKLARLTIQDWTLSNGTKVPKGVLMFANHLAVSMDDGTFKNATIFDPWRQYRLRQDDGQANMNQFVSATYENLTWGYGRHACPGRFFAANEIKLLFALILLRYDFKPKNPNLTLEDVTQGRWYNFSRLPLDNVEMEFHDRFAEIPADVRHCVVDV